MTNRNNKCYNFPPLFPTNNDIKIYKLVNVVWYNNKCNILFDVLTISMLYRFKIQNMREKPNKTLFIVNVRININVVDKNMIFISFLNYTLYMLRNGNDLIAPDVK
jgi:hypothetical protein